MAYVYVEAQDRVFPAGALETRHLGLQLVLGDVLARALAMVAVGFLALLLVVVLVLLVVMVLVGAGGLVVLRLVPRLLVGMVGVVVRLRGAGLVGKGLLVSGVRRLGREGLGRDVANGAEGGASGLGRRSPGRGAAGISRVVHGGKVELEGDVWRSGRGRVGKMRMRWNELGRGSRACRFGLSQNSCPCRLPIAPLL